MFGMVLAVVLRIVLSLLAVQLLAIPGLLLVGGLVLLWIAYSFFKELRQEGRRVLLHCVAAHHRTPSVALRYSVLLGAHVDVAAAQISSTLGRDIDGLLWKEAQR